MRDKPIDDREGSVGGGTISGTGWELMVKSLLILFIAAPASLTEQATSYEAPLEVSKDISLHLPDDQSGGSISKRGTKDIGLEDDLAADLRVEDVMGLVVCSGGDVL